MLYLLLYNLFIAFTVSLENNMIWEPRELAVVNAFYHRVYHNIKSYLWKIHQKDIAINGFNGFNGFPRMRAKCGSMESYGWHRSWRTKRRTAIEMSYKLSYNEMLCFVGPYVDIDYNNGQKQSNLWYLYRLLSHRMC